MSTLKNPPIFDPEGYNYRNWEKDILVACGFEEFLIERTDLPTYSKQSLRMLFTVTSTVN